MLVFGRSILGCYFRTLTSNRILGKSVFANEAGLCVRPMEGLGELVHTPGLSFLSTVQINVSLSILFE